VLVAKPAVPLHTLLSRHTHLSSSPDFLAVSSYAVTQLGAAAAVIPATAAVAVAFVVMTNARGRLLQHTSIQPAAVTAMLTVAAAAAAALVVAAAAAASGHRRRQYSMCMA
jgi:hypothetical protein